MMPLMDTVDEGIAQIDASFNFGRSWISQESISFTFKGICSEGKICRDDGGINIVSKVNFNKILFLNTFFNKFFFFLI